MIDIQDNFLPLNEFEQLRDGLLRWDFPWYIAHVVNDIEEYVDEMFNMQFSHLFYNTYSPQCDQISILEPILKKLQPIAIFKIKANMMPNQGKIVEHGLHTDVTDTKTHLINSISKIKDHMKTSILYLNTNNGYTKFEDGTKVESVANRMVTFPNHIMHTGTTTTDSQYRLVLNLNYI
tara:strand:+ start:920 stop:1453 length:534 start_codon:yes stop_codon:yes gene_type:complete